ncbi:MAG: glutamine synthetase [Deltaproteobacteria bacterium]|nr:glutamine synthetase [Deltaproteobacteria bacterium]
MNERPSTPQEIKKDLERRGIEHVKVGGFDIDGVLRGKYVSLSKFLSSIEGGFGFCDVIFGWDLDDLLYQDAHDPRAITGWHTGYPDAHATIDLSTYRVLPWEPNTAAFLVDFQHDDGAPHAACARSLLKSVLSRLADRGLRAKVACEFEFWLFREDAQSIREKGYRRLEPITPGMFGYSWLRSGQNADLVHAILEEMKAFDIEIEGFHTETGPGVYEAAIQYDDALRAADKAALFKTALKQICARYGVIPTFMAKWSADLPGSSGHLHQSLWNGEGENVLYSPEPDAGEAKLSSTGRNYVGGLVALAPDLTAVYSPTVNAYKRYVPGVWAPLTASWGIENRTTAIRIIPGSASSTRVEYRQTAADINPYTAIAACLGAGLYGIDRRIDPPPPSRGEASGGELVPLPRTLSEATTLLEKSAAAREVLGARFVDHYVRTRRHEIARFERAVTDWELQRYFEII